MAGFRSGNSRGFGGNRSSGRPRRSGGGFGGGFGGGCGRGRPGGRRFDDGDSGSFERRRPEMHEATCDKCGKNCEVPFRPTEGKPVLCSDCFNKDGGPRQRFSPRNNTSPRNNAPSSGISQEQYQEINKKLDKILAILNMIEFEEEGDEDSEEGSEDEESEEDTNEEIQEDKEKEENSEDNSKDEENSEEELEEESSA